MEKYILRGANPSSYYAESDELSLDWRKNYINDFFNKDVLTWEEYSPEKPRQLWRLLITTNGQMTNFKKIHDAINLPMDDVEAYISF
ncbi:MAG: hypothetical protein LBR22_09275 [Desulfovibrio sp.]|nr:hypothetical protein [Desulfovibrio sp.]